MILASCWLIFVVVANSIEPAVGFTSTSYRLSTRIRSLLLVVPLQTDEGASTTKEDGYSSYFSTPFLDFNASGSIGSLLMQMQKKEEEMRKLNKTLLDKAQAVDLSRPNATVPTVTVKKNEVITKAESTDNDEPEIMDPQKARELDEAITFRISSSPGKDVQVLELPDLYRVLQASPGRDEIDGVQAEVQQARNDMLTGKGLDDRPLLSKAEHYEKRIGRDMRQLAVSIAACIDDAEDYQIYCQQIRGGIYPLIECIREGADAIRHRGKSRHGESPSPSSYVSPNLGVSNQYEERFLAASSACRALRDLCGISSDLSAVITDTLLRANANKKASNLTEDLVAILQFAHEADISVSSGTRKRRFFFRRRSQSSKWNMNFSPNRRGTCLSF